MSWETTESDGVAPRPFEKLDVEDTIAKLTIDEKILILSGKDMVCSQQKPPV